MENSESCYDFQINVHGAQCEIFGSQLVAVLTSPSHLPHLVFYLLWLCVAAGCYIDVKENVPIFIFDGYEISIHLICLPNKVFIKKSIEI